MDFRRTSSGNTGGIPGSDSGNLKFSDGIRKSMSQELSKVVEVQVYGELLLNFSKLITSLLEINFNASQACHSIYRRLIPNAQSTLMLRVSIANH